MTATVESVHASSRHTMVKSPRTSIRLLAGLGIEGDAHCGATMKHAGRLRRWAAVPNTRQVHLIHAELHDELASRGLPVTPGQMGENITTRDLDLLALPTATRLHIGPDAIVEITGLRNPCKQLNVIHPGLMEATLERDTDRGLVRKTGVMGIVVTAGVVRPGDIIRVELPKGATRPLQPV